MKVPVFLLAIIGLAASSANYEFLEEWDLWKEDHEKNYVTDLEDLERHIVWLSNKKFIEQHNANAHIFGFTLAMNHFGDMTHGEFLESVIGGHRPARKQDYDKHTEIFSPPADVTYPDKWDWRNMNAVTAVKNEGYNCQASYAFSTIGALEGAYAIANKTLVALSEQNIIDCSVPYGNGGCRGGNMFSSYVYVITNEGVDPEEVYPYQGKQGSCKFDKSCALAIITNIVRVQTGSESDLQAAVATAGPIAVAIDASTSAFRFYQSGVFRSYLCSSSYLNHAMLLVGYGTYYGRDYWLIKNSWGTNWGMSGYIMMARNNYNQCGIASDASYPTL